METTTNNSYEYTRAEVTEIARTIWQQIKATTATNTLWSWGIKQVNPTIAKGRPALAMRVKARLLNGFLFVVYNDGADLYELYTCTATIATDDKLTRVIDGLYAEDLSGWIDRTIETGDNWQEYEAFCKEEERKLHQDIFS